MYFDMVYVIRNLTKAQRWNRIRRLKIQQTLRSFIKSQPRPPMSRHWLLEKIEEMELRR